MRLRYFVRKQRNKKLETSYYWQCKSSVAQKYGVEKCISLGKDEKEALIKWHELSEKLKIHKKSLLETGMLPINAVCGMEEGTLEHISKLYLEDRKFSRLSPRTQKNYSYIINRLNNQILVETQREPFRTLQISKMNRLFCKTLYERLLPKGNRIAEDFMKVLSNIMLTAIDYGYFTGENPCSKMKIEKNDPRDQVWTIEDFEKFCEIAKKKSYLGLYIAMNIGYYTAQRLTDILNLKWSQISPDFKYISIKQSKTDSQIEIPLYKMTKLQEILQNLERKNEYIVIDQTDDKPYNYRDRLFGDRFEIIRKESQIDPKLLFRDLRRTAILALDEAGCTTAEISSISGHSRQSILSMLEIYAPKSKRKAENAIEKLNVMNSRK